MKYLLTVLFLLIATTASAQVFVEFEWTQPDSTTGSILSDGSFCCKVALEDGDIEKYEIFTATPTDTLFYGEVPAPFTIAENATSAVEFTMLVPMSIAVRAIDIRGRTGALSEWSDPFEIDPGPPGVAGKPLPIRVYFGG